MTVASVIREEARCAAFVAHHRLAVASAGDDIELGDALGSGAFGAVHPVVRVGVAGTGGGVVAKVFDPDQLAADGGPRVILDGLEQLWDALEASGRSDWPDAILAVPFQMLTAQINGREHLVGLMIDLFARGYEPVPLSDQAALRAYRKRPLDERTAIALSFAERAELLADIAFIHGDLNPENVVWNPATLDVQVIDFDSGVVARTGRERPRTCGKQDGCMPPEVQAPALPGGVDVSAFAVTSERWSYASLIGYLLFTVHPAFFLAEMSLTSITAYAGAAERWPDIDQRSPLFTAAAQNRRAYALMLPVFASVPSEISELFADLFDAGLDPYARPSAAAWLSGLAGLSAPPDVEVELLSDDIVLEGEDVVIAWRARNATHVELAPGGRHPASGAATYVATEHFRVRVTAHNAFGSETVDGPVVRVMPLPRLERIVVPGFSGFQMPPLSIAAQLSPLDDGSRTLEPPPPALISVPPRRAHHAAQRVPAYPRPPRFPGLTSSARRAARR